MKLYNYLKDKKDKKKKRKESLFSELNNPTKINMPLNQQLFLKDQIVFLC